MYEDLIGKMAPEGDPPPMGACARCRVLCLTTASRAGEPTICGACEQHRQELAGMGLEGAPASDRDAVHLPRSRRDTRALWLAVLLAVVGAAWLSHSVARGGERPQAGEVRS